MLEVKFTKINKDAIAPTKNHSDDAGYDLYSLNEVTIPP